MLGAAGAVAVGLFASTASAALMVELQAVPGAGYNVSNGGKSVAFTGGVVPITMNLVGTVGTNSANDKILLVQGAIITNQLSGSGGATGGGNTVNIAAAFQNNSFFKGTNQVLSSATPENILDDGVGDVGPIGNGTTVATDLTGNTHTWAITGTGATTDFINLSQNAASALTGNQVMASVVLTPTGVGNGTTSVQWYWRSGTGNVSWTENAAQPARAFGTTVTGGAPVIIGSVPEPTTIGVLSLGAMGLLGSRRRRNA